MKSIFFIITVSLVLFSCGAKNATVREAVKKKISDSQTIGVNEFKKGNYSSAKLFLESALKDAYSIDNVEGMAEAMQNLSEVHLKLGNNTEASNYIFRAKNLSEREGLTNDFSLLLTIGKYYDKTAAGEADYGKAMENFQAALSCAKTDLEKALIYNSIGITRMKLNRLDEAADWFEKSRAINESGRIYDTLADNYFNLGEVSERKNDFQGAVGYYMKALQYDKIAEKSDGIVEDLKKIGIVYSKLNDNDKAYYYLNRAFHSAESMGYKTDQDEIQKLISSLK